MSGNLKPGRKKFERVDFDTEITNIIHLLTLLNLSKIMRNFVMSTLAVIIIAVLSFIGLRQCQKYSPESRHFRDSVKVAEIQQLVDANLSPTFSNVEDFIIHSTTESDYLDYVDTYTVLNTTTSATIAQKVIDTQKYVDWGSWLQEYRKHKDVYDAMDKVNAKKETPPDITTSEDTLSSFPNQYGPEV